MREKKIGLREPLIARILEAVMKHEQWTHVICHSTHIRIQSFFIAGCGHFESFAECLVRVNNIRCVNADKRRPHEHIIKPQLSYWISTRSTWRIVVNEIRTDPDTTYAESWCNSIDIIVHVLIECKLRWNAMHDSGRPFFFILSLLLLHWHCNEALNFFIFGVCKQN